MAETTTTNEKKYELRSLEAADIFTMAKIIKNIGIKEFKSIFNTEAIAAAATGNEKDRENMIAAVGVEAVIDIAGIVISNLPKAEADIYAFLNSLSGVEIEDIKKLPMDTFLEMIMDVIRQDGFKDFIKVVSKLFK